MKVEVTVADILRSFTSGVISERIAIRKLEKLMEFQYQLGYVKGVAEHSGRKFEPFPTLEGAFTPINTEDL